MASLEDSYIEFAFGSFRARRHATLPPYLLLVDCETRRFTIERPDTKECFDLWCREVEHAIVAGRHIVCVPIHDRSTGEIESLGTSLGYAQWPSRTILSPSLSEVWNAGDMPSGAGPKEDGRKLRPLARAG